MGTPLGLIGDIGGTNARFALVGKDGGWSDEQVLPCAAFPGPAEAIAAYLAAIGVAAPRRAALCVASPVLGDMVDLTNNPWRFSIEASRRALGLDALEVMNDFAANALACPLLEAGDVTPIGSGAARAGFPIAAIGPGTGLGVALLVPDASGGWHAVPTEGGHVTLPATTDREAEVIAAVRAGLGGGHVSAERLVSGPGLALLYETLRGLAGNPVGPTDPAQITATALTGEDTLAVEALDLFCGFLGSVAGNLALTTGALGGVYIMGGIVPRILETFAAGPFRARFEAKGRFADYLTTVPTFAVTHPYPAFLGLRGQVWYRQTCAG